MKKLLALLPATALLASCSVIDLVGPRSNDEIMTLAKQATADDFALDNDPVAGALRASQADALVAEARRLCGTDAAGETPKTCNLTVDNMDLPQGVGDTGQLIDQVRSSTVAVADELPEESLELVIGQAIDIVALRPAELDPLALNPATLKPDSTDLTAARDMLAREFELEYGLSLATAFADESLSERIEARRVASDERRAVLVRVLEPTGDVPSYRPGYEVISGNEPTDAASAIEFVEHLEENLVAQWRKCATDASSDGWRAAVINLAAHAQRG